MQTQSQLKESKKIKKSQTLLIGSLLVFFGFLFISSDYLLGMRDEVFSDMKLAMMDPVIGEIQSDAVAENISSGGEEEYHEEEYVYDYSGYYGILEIPNIGLKRGFYNFDSEYNNIQRNVTMIAGSTMPDVNNGNLILVAHSGDSYISYFAYLWQLNIGDECFISYNGRTYTFSITNIYTVDKIGIVNINRNPNKTTLTLITCTKDSDTLQTVYIAELVG